MSKERNTLVLASCEENILTRGKHSSSHEMVGLLVRLNVRTIDLIKCFVHAGLILSLGFTFCNSYCSMVHSIWKKKNTYWNLKIIYPTWFTRNLSRRETSTTSKYGKRRRQREDNSMKCIQVSNTLFKRAHDRPQANWTPILSAGVIYSRLFNYTQHTAPPNTISERAEHFLIDMIVWSYMYLIISDYRHEKKIEDIKGDIRSRNLKDRQYNS